MWRFVLTMACGLLRGNVSFLKSYLESPRRSTKTRSCVSVRGIPCSFRWQPAPAGFLLPVLLFVLSVCAKAALTGVMLYLVAERFAGERWHSQEAASGCSQFPCSRELLDIL